MKGGPRCSTCFGLRYAFYFYGMSWRRFECVFGLYNNLQWVMNKSMVYSSQTSLKPVHRPWRDERLSRPGREILTKNLVSGACDSRHLLRLRSTCPRRGGAPLERWMILSFILDAFTSVTSVFNLGLTLPYCPPLAPLIADFNSNSIGSLNDLQNTLMPASYELVISHVWQSP